MSGSEFAFVLEELARRDLLDRTNRIQVGEITVDLRPATPPAPANKTSAEEYERTLFGASS